MTAVPDEANDPLGRSRLDGRVSAGSSRSTLCGSSGKWEGKQWLLLAEDRYQVRIDPIHLPFDQLRQVPEAPEVQGRRGG